MPVAGTEYRLHLIRTGVQHIQELGEQQTEYDDPVAIQYSPVPSHCTLQRVIYNDLTPLLLAGSSSRII